jgi:hypothetical protein
MSLHFSCAASPLLRVPGSPALMLFGLVSGYVLLSSFAFGVMVNFFVSRPLAYFTGKASVFVAGRGRTGSAGFVVAALQFQTSVNTSGNIKAVGISVYSDPLGTVVATKVDWGMVAPGQTVNANLYMKSTSNVAGSVSFAVGNFVPASGSTYLACTWNYSGGVLNPGVIVPVTFTLTVASTITGITSFSFDIGVVGSG